MQAMGTARSRCHKVFRYNTDGPTGFRVVRPLAHLQLAGGVKLELESQHQEATHYLQCLY